MSCSRLLRDLTSIITQPPPSSLHRLVSGYSCMETEARQMEGRTEGDWRQKETGEQKRKGPRQSTEWTQAEGEQEGGEGGLVNTAPLPPASTRGIYYLHVTAYISLFHTTHMILQYLLSITLFTAASKCTIVPVRCHGAVLLVAVVRGPEWPYPCPGPAPQLHNNI